MRIYYQCEICGKKSKNKKDIKKCESQGLFDGSFYKPGTMFEVLHDNHEFCGIFAIPKGFPVPFSGNRHMGNLPFWACRDNGSGDNVEELCTGDLVHSGKKGFKEWINNHFITANYKRTPAFKRMVKALKQKGIIPRYYDKNGKLHVFKTK